MSKTKELSHLHLVNNKDSSPDVFFKFHDQERDEIVAHYCILRVRAPQILEIAKKRKNVYVVQLNQRSHFRWSLLRVLTYIYCGTVDFSTMSPLESLDVMYYVQLFNLTILGRMTKRYIRKCVSMKNVYPLLLRAKDLDIIEVQIICMNFALSNLDFFTSKNAKQLDFDTYQDAVCILANHYQKGARPTPPEITKNRKSCDLIKEDFENLYNMIPETGDIEFEIDYEIVKAHRVMVYNLSPELDKKILQNPPNLPINFEKTTQTRQQDKAHERDLLLTLSRDQPPSSPRGKQNRTESRTAQISENSDESSFTLPMGNIRKLSANSSGPNNVSRSHSFYNHQKRKSEDLSQLKIVSANHQYKRLTAEAWRNMLRFFYYGWQDFSLLHSCQLFHFAIDFKLTKLVQVLEAKIVKEPVTKNAVLLVLEIAETFMKENTEYQQILWDRCIHFVNLSMHEIDFSILETMPSIIAADILVTLQKTILNNWEHLHKDIENSKALIVQQNRKSKSNWQYSSPSVPDLIITKPENLDTSSNQVNPKWTPRGVSSNKPVRALLNTTSHGSESTTPMI